MNCGLNELAVAVAESSFSSLVAHCEQAWVTEEFKKGQYRPMNGSISAWVCQVLESAVGIIISFTFEGGKITFKKISAGLKLMTKNKGELKF